MKKRKFVHLGIIILAALFLGFFDLPSDTQKQLIPFTPQEILNSKINLGLDLQGGSQLDYKIDLRSVPADQKKSIVEGILSVINKRVNSLGVSEPNIYTSDIADEKHLIVELAGIKDLEEAKAIVGKTIQLEFKEKKDASEMNDPNLEAEVKAQAQSLLDKVKAGADISLLGKEEEQANPGKVFFYESAELQYKDQIGGTFTEDLFKLEAGQVMDKVMNSSGNMTVDEAGNFVEGPKGFHVLKVTEKQDTERTTDYPREVGISHILIAHKDGQAKDETITRTSEEALTRAQEALQKLKDGGDFAEIAKEYSDDPGSKEKGGVLGDTASVDKGNYVKEFETAAVGLTEVGQLTDPVESPFGYHVIKANSITEAKTETTTEPQIKFIDIYYSAAPDQWKNTGLNGQHFVRADVEFNQNTFTPYVAIQFDSEGGKMFEDLTRKNVGKQIAIFVGGEPISAPNVNEVIAGGSAQITGNFTLDSANELARDLNTGAIPAPITLAGQYTIGATLGHDALDKSIWSGLLGFLILSIFMTIFYRLPGLLAVFTLCIYSAILLFVIKVSLPIGWALGASIFVFAYLIHRILKSHDTGSEKAITAILAAFVLFFLAFILASPIVLTLAGIAGVILSIGMAVDANILIFERIKEEIRDGKSLGVAIEVGFDRAWNSIRDSNFSSLITCGILFYFGSSIIQGFAFNLAAGILISMFTAITITKTFLNVLASTKLGRNLWLFGAPKIKEKKPLQIVAKRKILYIISAIILVITLLGVPLFGLKLGLDFTGGTLMDLKFENQVTVDQLRGALTNSEEPIKKGILEINNNGGVVPATEVAANETITTEATETAEEATTEETPSDDTASTDTDEPDTTVPVETSTENNIAESSPGAPEIVGLPEEVDFSKAQIVPSDEGYLIKTPHISTYAHDILIKELEKELGPLEETRFSTVGPTVGANLQQKAISAVLIAAGMIVLYIAFAFRRVPRYIGKWRFGMAAIVALVHDLAIMLGVYVYLGVFLGVEIDVLFITALLTVLGFSVHDTIVVFDRIREKLKYQKREETFEDVANQALNDTMARSINTSLSTLIVLLTVAIFGPETIRYFIISLIVGILSGTYSSIFIATPILVDWQNYVRNKRK